MQVTLHGRQRHVQGGVVEAHDQQAHAADPEYEHAPAMAQLWHASHRTPISIVRLTNECYTIFEGEGGEGEKGESGERLERPAELPDEPPAG
ncbi:hypothetical protein GCM10017687_51090 [Streptomyces echinatus]